MKRFLVIGAMVVLAAGFAPAASIEADGEFNLKVTSAFTWRGEVINDEACFQPSVILGSVSGMSFRAWGSWDLTDPTNASEHTRADLTLDYAFQSGRSVVRSGITGYIYADTTAGAAKEDTFEVFVRNTFDVPLMPSIAVYYDFVDIEGWYLSAGVSHHFTFSEVLGMDLCVDVGAGDKNYVNAVFSRPSDGTGFVPDKSGLTDLNASIAWPISIRDNFVIEPAIKYSSLLDNEIRDAVDAAGGETDITSYSINLRWYF